MLLKAAFVPPEPVRDELAWLTGEIQRLVPGAVPARRGHWLGVTAFGNVTAPDAVRIENTLQDAFGGVEDAPVVRFEQVFLTPDGSIRVGMAGDVDLLVALARVIPVVVARLDLYVDRRAFWPGMELCRLVPSAKQAEADRHLALLRGWAGSAWEASALGLMRQTGDTVSVHSLVEIGPVPAATGPDIFSPSGPFR